MSKETVMNKVYKTMKRKNGMTKGTMFIGKISGDIDTTYSDINYQNILPIISSIVGMVISFGFIGMLLIHLN